MEFKKVYKKHGLSVNLASINGELYVNLPNSNYFIKRPEENTGLWSLEDCSSCGMPLQEYQDPYYGNIYTCYKCQNYDFWIQATYSNLLEIKMSDGRWVGQGNLAQIINNIIRDEEL